jgi:hypothetical protein
VRSLLTILLLAQAVFSAMAANFPLTAKEIGLMLRSGFSSETVLHELTALCGNLILPPSNSSCQPGQPVAH